MRNLLLTLTFLAAIITANKSNAQNPALAGGELLYVHISDSTYQFFAKLYFNCSGSAAPDSIPLCFIDSCSNTSFSTSMQKFGNPSKLSTGCSNVKTNCDSIGSVIQGYTEVFYNKIVTMPLRCNAWRIFTYPGKRDQSYNITNATATTLYLEVWMNNAATHNNSSPFYSVKPISYAALNNNTTYNAGPIDPDNDSLRTFMTWPLTNVTSCNDTATRVNLPSATPSYNLVNNPIQTNNTFSLSSTTGYTSFTPTQAGSGALAFVTYEYRNGVFMSSVMREMKTNVHQVSNNDTIDIKPACGLSSVPIGINNRLYGCTQQQLSYCLDIISSNGNGKIHITDNIATTIPGANITYQNQGTDSVRLIFNWLPSTNQTGLFSNIIYITDSTCNFPGIVKQHAYPISYFIQGNVIASADTSICNGSVAFLNVNGGANYLWTVLPGGDSNSLSNPNIANPIAFPSKTTTYIVTSTFNPNCNNNTDTVTVYVDNPTINITSVQGHNINYGDTVTFNAIATDCDSPKFQWMIDGVAIQGATNSGFSVSTLFDQQDVSCKLVCNNSCPNSKTRLSNIITMNVNTPQKNTNNSVAGGELLYVHVSGTTYQFFFKMYRDCFGKAEPDSVPLCLYNPCTNTTQSLNMGKWQGTPPSGPATCSWYKSACDSPGSTIPGYTEHWYSTIINLPLRCNSWKAFTSIPGRNYSYNLQNSTNLSLFAEATLNNSLSYNNSSPFYSVKPIYYLTKGKTYTYNNGALDADGDSLVTELIAPLSGGTSCQYGPIPISFTNSTPAFNLINNPFSTGNSFYLNNQNGMMMFTASTLGKANMAVRTNEYRNGTLIGSVTREIQTVTLEQTAGGADITRIYGCSSLNVTNDTVHGCAGEPISFCFTTASSDSGALLSLSDNVANAIPNATISYTQQGTDSVLANFSWTPTRNDIGTHSLFIIVTDSACRPPGIIYQLAEELNIRVWGGVNSINDTTICPGTSVTLTTTGGADYIWTILPGGTPNSLSDTVTANPVAMPSRTTNYVVTSGIAPYCPNSRDTVTVSLYPQSTVSTPAIRITIAPDSIFKENDTVTFTAVVSGCNNASYQWSVNGVNITGATQSTFSNYQLISGDKVSCQLLCADICATNKDTFSNTITVKTYGTSVSDIQPKSISLYPNPNNGYFTISAKDMANDEASINVVNTLGQIVHSEQISSLYRHHLNLQHLAKGLYTLKVISGITTSTTLFEIR